MSTAPASPIVSVVMVSKSDWPTMEKTSQTLDALGVPHETRVMSAHRSPDAVAEHARTAADRGLRVIIAAAGGAAHLAGVIAAHTPLPVLGVPMQAWSLDGLDSLLSTVQMPRGVPVATFAIGSAGAVNAAIFAAQILAQQDDHIAAALERFRGDQTANSVCDPRRD